MTEKDQQTLLKLLKNLKKDNLVPPNTPHDIWHEIATLVPMPAVEVIVTNNGTNFLLTERRDKNWNGWHIPGGFILYKETIEEACIRVAKTELGIDILFQKFINAHVWKDHPYGSPISLICVARSNEVPRDGTFFNEIPSDTIPHHVPFLKEYLNSIK